MYDNCLQGFPDISVKTKFGVAKLVIKGICSAGF